MLTTQGPLGLGGGLLLFPYGLCQASQETGGILKQTHAPPISSNRRAAAKASAGAGGPRQGRARWRGGRPGAGGRRARSGRRVFSNRGRSSHTRWRKAEEAAAKGPRALAGARPRPRRAAPRPGVRRRGRGANRVGSRAPAFGPKRGAADLEARLLPTPRLVRGNRSRENRPYVFRLFEPREPGALGFRPRVGGGGGALGIWL